MGKARRNRDKRKTATAVQSVTPEQLRAVFGDSWHDLDDSDSFDVPEMPDEALMNTSGCPVAPVCAGCGAQRDLHAVTTAFSRPEGWDVGCATLCLTCDGQSFVALLGFDGLQQAFERHGQHRQHQHDRVMQR